MDASGTLRGGSIGYRERYAGVSDTGRATGVSTYREALRGGGIDV